MIAILWTYKVRPEHRPAFEATYGPAGDWARLFARQDGYLGTELLRGEDGAYLTIDRWRAQADFEAFLAAYRADYEALDRVTECWTVEERRIGWWEGKNARHPGAGSSVSPTELASVTKRASLPSSFQMPAAKWWPAGRPGGRG